MISAIEWDTRGLANLYLPIKPPGSPERRIDGVWSVCCCHDNDARTLVALDAVHLRQQRRDHALLDLSAATIFSAGTDSIHLVQYNNAWCLRTRICKHTAEAGLGLAMVRRAELWAVNDDDGRAGRRSNGTGKMRLSCARRAMQEQTTRWLET